MTIPDYELLQRCGRGAYGEVWLARSRSGQRVALKIMEREAGIEKEFAGLVNYAKQKESPHLIRVLHTGETADGLYYTMELADNFGTVDHYVPATLANLLKQRKRLPPAETIELGQRLLYGLKALHDAGLIHRDVKPENILYVNGIPKLSDIGLIRSVSQTLSVGGTLHYIPPERLHSNSSGKGNGITDDLYALGKVLYCCVTGNQVEAFPSFPPELIRETECRRLNKIILTACDPAPFQRFRNLGEFEKSLILGISRKKRFVDGVHKWRYILTAIPGFFMAGYLFWPHSEAALKLGGIAQRSALDIIAYGHGLQYLPRPGDVLHKRINPDELDGAPRRKLSVYRENFSTSKNWFTDDGFNFIFWNHSLIIGTKGAIRLKQSLPEAYVLRFNVDCTGLNGDVRFRVVIPGDRNRERSYYEWMLSRASDGRLTVSPVKYQPEDGTALSFVPMAFNGTVKKNLRIEMVQTEGLFRVYADSKLVLYTPSFVAGGFFMIGANEEQEAGYCLIRDLEIASIPQDSACPASEQYQLPIPEPKETPPTASKPVIELTEARLKYLYRSHTARAMAQIFGTNEKTVEDALATHNLWAAQLKPGNVRQPRTRLSVQEIEKLRRKLAELR